MKRILLLTLLLLSTSLFSQSKLLTIATFNCEFLNTQMVHIKYGLPFRISDASDSLRNIWTDSYRKEKFKEASKNVAEVIVKTDADVICLTEIGNLDDLKVLQNELMQLGKEYKYIQVCDSRDFTTKQHVGVLSRFELTNVIYQIPGRETYIKEPDDPETEDDTGISKGMKVEFKAFDNDFVLYVLHLASERGGNEQDQQRIAQASIARRNMLPYLQNNANVIVCGDFNDKKGQPAIHRIRGLDDIQPDLIQTGLAEYFDEDKLDTRWTYQYMGVRQQIDHILLSYGIKDICKRGGIKAKTIEHNNPLVSDHKPLVVTLKLK